MAKDFSMIRILPFLFPFLFVTEAHAQIKIDHKRASNLRKEKVEEDSSGWQVGTALGIDFFQLLQINPKVGAGEDRIQFGGLSTVFGIYKKDRLEWENVGTLLFAVQRLGSGSTMIGSNVVPKPYQKTVDEFRIVSSLSYDKSKGSDWSYSGDFIFISQVVPTYPGNFLRDVSGENEGPISRFFSPAQISFSPGSRYQPNENWRFIASPASFKAIVVADDAIASIPGKKEEMVGLHGTVWRGENDFENVFFQFGASFRTLYKNKYAKEKLKQKSELVLFSNYLVEAKNIDLNWRNELSYELFSGLTLNFIANFFYDHDVLIRKTDWDEPDGIDRNPDGSPRLSRGLNVIQSFTVQYNYIF
jgi:hypothetical protein